MKRLLIILLLVVVPLQTALAAACFHGAHAGTAQDRHADAHGLDTAAAGVVADVHAEAHAGTDAGTDAPAGHAGECALCHLGCGSALPHVTRLPVISVTASSPPSLHAVYEPSHLDRIERVPLSGARSS
jgi:hypothetical protein